MLGGNLSGGNYNIFDVYKVTANKFDGPLYGTVYDIDIRDIYSVLFSFDFGEIVQEVSSMIEYIQMTIDLDMGSFTNPNQLSIDDGYIRII
jgi:hypothetical protein